MPDDDRRTAYYRSLIDPTKFETVKRHLQAGRDIQEVIIIDKKEDLATIAASLDCDDSQLRRERGLAMAKLGVIQFAVKDPEAVLGPWKPFVVPLGSLDDGRNCRVIYGPPAYYVKLEE